MSRSTATLRRALAGAAALALIPLSAGAASAATLALEDGPGDVKTFDFTSDSGFAPAPDQRDGDILRTVFKHSPQQVSIRTKFAELTRTGRGISMAARMRTDEGFRRMIELDAGPRGKANPRGWHGYLFMSKPNGDKVECKGMTRDIDWAANTIVVTVPRSCLSAPTTVQFTQMSMRAVTRSDIYFDNPHNHRAIAMGWTDPIKRG